MSMPRQSHPCNCDECIAAQRMSMWILTSFCAAMMIVAIVASLIFA